MKIATRLLGLVLIATTIIFIIRRSVIIPHDRSSSLTHQFKEQETVRFFALGDTGTGSKDQLAVAQRMEERCQKQDGIDGILLLGDQFYQTGVTSVEDPQWQHKINKPYRKPCLSRSPIFPTLGNHDYKGNVQAQIHYSAMSSQWLMPYRFYRIDFGNYLRLIVFDSNFPDFCFLSNTCSIDFLRHQLAHADDKWTLVTAHYPLASASTNKKGNYRGDTILASTLKYLICDQANAWLSGHSHHLEHKKLPTCQTELFISGGGGAPVDPVDTTQASSKFVQSSHGFLDIEVTSQKMTFTFIDKEGKELYQYTKLKS